MTNEVKIVDKVKFWEEQNQINQVLIPRVLELHKQLISVGLLSQQNSASCTQLRSELSDLQDNIIQQYDDLKTHHKTLSEALDELSSSISLKSEQQKALNKEIFQKINNLLENQENINAEKEVFENRYQKIEAEYHRVFSVLSGFKSLMENQHKSASQIAKQQEKQDYEIQEILEIISKLKTKKYDWLNICALVMAVIALVMSFY